MCLNFWKSPTKWTFNEVALKDIFHHGLDESLCYKLHGGKIHFSLEEYTDYVLSLSGSNFTVGFTEEEQHKPTVSSQPESRLPDQSPP